MEYRMSTISEVNPDYSATVCISFVNQNLAWCGVIYLYWRARLAAADVRKHSLLFTRTQLSSFQSCRQKIAKILMQNDNTAQFEILRRTAKEKIGQNWSRILIRDFPILFALFFQTSHKLLNIYPQLFEKGF